MPVHDADGNPVRDSKGRPKRKQAGKACPDLRRSDGSWNPKHGTWEFSLGVKGRDGKNRQVVRGGYPSQKAAQDAMDQLKHRADKGAVVTERPTVEQYLTGWLERKEPELRPSTFNSYRGHVERTLVPELGHHRLDSLRVDQVEPVLRAVPGSDANRQRVRGTLRAALSDALRQGLVTVNVAALVKLPTGQKVRAVLWTREREARWREQVDLLVKAGKSASRARESAERPSPVMVWTPAQVGRFLDATAGDRLAALWALLAYCGMRRGEVAGLRWEDVDLDAGKVTVARQLTVVEWTVYEGEPKTQAGHRTFPLDPVALEPLRAWRKAQTADRLRAGAGWQGTANRVFTGPDGADLHPGWISSRFADLAAEADLPPIRLHDVRHSAASAMLAAGVDMKVVQETLGHSQLAVTADIYSSVVPELSEGAAAATAAIIPRSS